MLKQINKNVVLIASYMLIVACSSDESQSLSDNQTKTPIDLSVGIVGEKAALTRGVVTSSNASEQPLTRGTSIYMVLKSENKSNTAADAMYSRTIGFAQGTTTGNNTVKFSANYGRFWEDSYSRNSQLSVLAVCVPGYYLDASLSQDAIKSGTVDATTWTLGGSNDYDNQWATNNGSTTISWPLRNVTAQNQDVDFVNSQDLCFSNNVSDLGNEDKRVVFSDEHKKFGSGLMVFYHALSRVTFKIKKGEGFEENEKFEFSNQDENVVLKGFNSSGTFNIAEGGFTDVTSGTIKALAVSETNTTDGYAYVLDGLMLPGTNLDDATADQINFTINSNLYHLTKKKLFDALSNTSGLTSDGKMRPGVHYVFTMTVGKKKMDSFTASIVPWTKVDAAEQTPSNARISLSLIIDGAEATSSNYALYRSANISTDFNDDFTSYDWAKGYKGNQWDTSTTWYWPNNKTFYHFRAAMPAETVIQEDSESQKEYLTLTPGATLSDVCWGAPFTAAPAYDFTNGFDGSTPHAISKAIGPTMSTIDLMMFHMMSDVTIKLTTSDEGKADRVDLTNAKIELSNIYPSGRVMMGNGLVTSSDAVQTVSATVGTDYTWHYYFVPQLLDDVKLVITTADDNKYEISMKGISSINGWEPNHQYTYTFKLTKTDVKSDASLTKWKEVDAATDIWF